MEKKLIHIFKKEYHEKDILSEPDKRGYRRVLKHGKYFIRLNGIFDDGTWEPLLEYKRWEEKEPLNLRNVKGIFYSDRSKVIQTLKELYESGKYKTLVILID